MHDISLNKLQLGMPSIDVMTLEGQRLQRPISDHSPMIQNTLWGAIASFNMLHPGSPFAPSFQKAGVRALPQEGELQMRAVAQYIFSMFKQGVALLALQEVPAAHSANFRHLKNELQRLVDADMANLLDVESLGNQWLQTGTHAFGTSVLYNPSLFELSPWPKHDLNKRAACYLLTTKSSIAGLDGYKIPVANIHGDYQVQADTAKYIANFDGFCLGDSNIVDSDMVTLGQKNKDNLLQSIHQPSANIDGEDCVMNTYDIIQDSRSRAVDPYFVADINEITVKPPQMLLDTMFQARMIQIASSEIEAILQSFAAYLLGQKSPFVHETVIDGLGVIRPIPGGYSRFTISNAELYRCYLAFKKAALLPSQSLELPLDFEEGSHQLPALEGLSAFELQKRNIQRQFLDSLSQLDLQLSACVEQGSFLYHKGQALYHTLYDAQELFFDGLSAESDIESVSGQIADFRKVCHDNVKDADRIMGHGYLYRIAEVLIKACVALFAGIGMLVAACIGQGLLNPVHRKAYRDTFFSFHQTDASKSLGLFKTKVLGDDEQENGLLNEEISHHLSAPFIRGC